MLERLRRLDDRSIPMVGDVRGRGLMIGIEIVKDQRTAKPPPVRDRIVDLAFERGLLFLGCGENSFASRRR